MVHVWAMAATENVVITENVAVQVRGVNVVMAVGAAVPRLIALQDKPV